MSAASTTPAETRAFQAETKRLLDLVIHSLYTHKEIFLRELISNAADALDRLRFEALTKPDLLGPDEKLEITIEADPATRVLTISDNGVGMNREEVIENIGSIAKSGTREMLDRLKDQKTDGPLPPEMIGNFGVGFYSAFMVAERVILETLRADSDEAARWESRGDGEYTISPGSRRKRGTSITLHLKPVDAEAGIEDYADEWTIERIVKRYSDFVAHPVKLKIRKQKEQTDEKGVIAPDGTTTIVTEERTLNTGRPLWTRPESEVPDSEYNEFYQQVTGDWEDPLLRLVLKAEGVSEYQAVLFIPERGPQDLYLYGAEYGPRLYAKGVMIMERCGDLLPRHLRFVQGVVDAADLPLNVSRQMLQENRHVAQIRKWLTKKVLDRLAKLQSEEPGRYKKFWRRYGRALKEGVSLDFLNRDRLLDLFLFESSEKPADELTTLKEHVGRLKDDEKEIYYLAGDSRAICENSPLLEAFRAVGREVLFFTDPVDEFMIQQAPEYAGRRFRSVAKGEAALGGEEARKKAAEERGKASEDFKGLLDRLKTELEDHVKQVRLSSRLTESPACLAGDEHDMSPTIERLMRMSAEGEAPRQKRILELNPKHAVIVKLRERFEADREDPLIGEYAHMLHAYASLAEGGEPPDPARFNKLLAELMTRAV